MSTEEEDVDFFHKVTLGNKSAAEFLHLFFLACHVWDDLIDKDIHRTDDHINHAFWVFAVEIPRNPWFQRNFSDIHPVMMNAIQEWFTANKLEKNGRTDIAYTLRCSIVSVIHQTALLCGGYEWAIEVGEEIRLTAQAETYEKYLGELDAGCCNGNNSGS